LDSLGFPWILSSESRLINGLRGIDHGRFFLAAFSLGGIRAGAGYAVEAIWKGRIGHEASLGQILIFCNKLSSLIATAVDGPASAVMAGLVPAIHVVGLRHRFVGQDTFLSSIA
jgi:hypothetical protein